MTFTNAVCEAFCAVDGVIDKLELELGIPVSDREFLAMYQTQLATKSTRKDLDKHFLNILNVWMIQRHRITA